LSLVLLSAGKKFLKKENLSWKVFEFAGFSSAFAASFITGNSISNGLEQRSQVRRYLVCCAEEKVIV
jgi:hypothetical protein